MAQFDLRDFFKISDDRLFASEIFYILEDMPYEADSRKVITEKVGSVTMEKSVVAGNGLDISKCEQTLKKYGSLLVFDNPLIFSLVVGNVPVYEYKPKNENFIINDIGVVGKITYMSEDAVASPVCISVKSQSDNTYFMNFREYFLKDETRVSFGDGEFFFRYNHAEDDIPYFELGYGDNVLLKLTGVAKTVTYPYVLYVLDNLPKKQAGFNVFVCTKIERK